MKFDKMSTTYDIIVDKDFMLKISDYKPGKDFFNQIDLLEGVKYDMPWTTPISFRVIIDAQNDTEELHEQIKDIVREFK